MKRTLLASLLFLAACRGDSGSGDDAPDAGGDTDDMSIYDIQGSLPVDGTSFNVRGVVVTAIDEYGSRKGNIFVQEPDGGAYSGVLVFGLELGDVADLELGDVIDLEGVTKDEFALTDDTSGRTTTELVPPEGGAITVTVIEQGEVPAPELVDTLAIGLMTDADARDDEFEKWEGVLITLENVTALSTLDQIGSTPQDPPFEDFRVTGPLLADTSLSTIEEITFNECLASVTGIGDYFFNYKILPRSTSDIVHGGAGCPEAEFDVDANACADTVDNDANGFADCDDNGCGLFAACSTDTTVSAIQMGTVAPGDNATLTEVFVTAIDAVEPHVGFWVSDNAQAAAYEGVYVYNGEFVASIPAGLTIGQLATVTGEVDEFDLGVPTSSPPTGDTVTQLEAPGTAVTLVAGSTPVALGGIAANTLAHIDDGEPYEGVLVTLSNMKVTASASGNRKTLTNGSQTIVMDDDAFGSYSGVTIVDNVTCFETITGVMSLNIFDDQRRLMPRNAADMDMVGGTCP